jgi:hypothetical protein
MLPTRRNGYKEFAPKCFGSQPAIGTRRFLGVLPLYDPPRDDCGRSSARRSFSRKFLDAPGPFGVIVRPALDRRLRRSWAIAALPQPRMRSPAVLSWKPGEGFRHPFRMTLWGYPALETGLIVHPTGDSHAPRRMSWLWPTARVRGRALRHERTSFAAARPLFSAARSSG